jgi:hypothetical protein
MLSLLPLVLTGAVAVIGPPAPAPAPAASVRTPASLLLEAPERHVRATHPRIKSLLVDGFSRSPTFASLLAALNRTDVIVYIEPALGLPKDMMGRLSLVPVPGKNRYLRVQIRADLPPRDAIALIAHEMQHALEIAEASDVRDPGGMVKLYERIGHPTVGDHSYDTIAAQDTGRRVKRELVTAG